MLPSLPPAEFMAYAKLNGLLGDPLITNAHIVHALFGHLNWSRSFSQVCFKFLCMDIQTLKHKVKIERICSC